MIEITQERPKNLKAEALVLAGILGKPEWFHEANKVLTKDHFFDVRNKCIYQAIENAVAAGKQPDMMAIYELMDKKEVGLSYFNELTSQGVFAIKPFLSAVNSVFFAYSRRAQIDLYIAQAQALFDESDPIEISNTVIQELQRIGFSEKDNAEHIKDILPRTIKQIEISSQSKELVGVCTGIVDLDKLTGGWQEPNNVIVAARPGMGKTVFMLQMAINAGVPILIFSMEMSKEQLVKRLISNVGSINNYNLRDGKMDGRDWSNLQAASDTLVEMDIIIDDTPGISPSYMYNAIRKFRSQYSQDKAMVLIDYLQLMVDKKAKGNREQEVSGISRAIKGFAKEFKVPIITLSQLSRSVETRGGDKKPMLSDLRESGAIEQDADIVIFLYRPEYYQIEQDENGNSTEGQIEFIVAKHRDGALKSVFAKFEGKFLRISEAEKDYYSASESFLPTTDDALERYGSIRPLQYLDNDDDIDDVPF